MNDRPAIRPGVAVGEALRAVARDILTEARTAIDDPAKSDAERVHDFRRAMKSWRALLRLLFNSTTFRRKGAGTFQVTTVPTDWALTSTFSTAGVLIAGQVQSRVVAINGQPEVRPMMCLTLSADHGVWDGRAAARLLAAVKTEMELADAALPREQKKTDDAYAPSVAGRGTYFDLRR